MQLVYIQKRIKSKSYENWIPSFFRQQYQIENLYQAWPKGWVMSLMKVSDLALLASQNEGYPLDGDRKDIFNYE